MGRKISERQLEDYVCKYPSACINPGFERFPVKIIQRQVRLNHGILDILARDTYSTLVVELKARALQESDIGQVLRYTFDVTTELQNFCGQSDIEYEYQPLSDEYNKEFVTQFYHHTAFGIDPLFRRPIIPILIGKPSKENFLAAAHAAYIDVIFWSFDSENNRFGFQNAQDIEEKYCNEREYIHPGGWMDDLIAEIKTSCSKQANRAAVNNYMRSLTSTGEK